MEAHIAAGIVVEAGTGSGRRRRSQRDYGSGENDGSEETHDATSWEGWLFRNGTRDGVRGFGFQA
jgi:hypothetical protein